MSKEKKIIEFTLQPDYEKHHLENAIRKKWGTMPDSYKILLKSLDARQKNNIHWNIRIEVDPEKAKTANPELLADFRRIETPDKKVAIAGSGPAGMFAALVLQLAGFDVSVFERGDKVEERSRKIYRLDHEGIWDGIGNYSFGEGGAGTFSDGKLTSRTKTIAREKQFVFETFVECGAPEEILYLAHPHIGSNYLRNVVANLRGKFENAGGKIYFQCKVSGFENENEKIKRIITSKGKFETNHVIFATGNAATDTWKMLISKGVKFVAKPFALGMRAEHRQITINTAQWHQKSINGLKSAEYALTDHSGPASVYSFCMCPGGQVISSSAFPETLVVNGMSHYERNSPFANAAIVSAAKPEDFGILETEAVKMIDKIEAMEKHFYSYTGSLKAPAIRIADFLNNKTSTSFPETSYKHGLVSFDPNELFPAFVIDSLRSSIFQFSKKMRHYEEGILLGLESKTSAAVQALRDDKYRAAGFDNLYICGEGSGFSGGITSSAADGIKTALGIISQTA